jgi:hypothetical protein
MNNLYKENHKPLKKEIEEDLFLLQKVERSPTLMDW